MARVWRWLTGVGVAAAVLGGAGALAMQAAGLPVGQGWIPDPATFLPPLGAERSAVLTAPVPGSPGHCLWGAGISGIGPKGSTTRATLVGTNPRTCRMAIRVSIYRDGATGPPPPRHAGPLGGVTPAPAGGNRP